MEEEIPVPVPETPAQEPTAGTFENLVGIFVSPTATFQALRRRPTWLVPLLLTTLMAGGFTVVLDQVIGREEILRIQLEQSPRLSQEQIDQISEGMGESTLGAISFFGTPIIGLLLVVPLMGGVFLLMLTLLGLECTFRQVISVTCYSFFLYQAVNVVLATVIVLLASDPASLNLQNLVQSNLGFLADPSENRVSFALLSSIDVFSFYYMYLLALGFSICTRSKSLILPLLSVGIPWLIYVAGKMAIGLLLS